MVGAVLFPVAPLFDVRGGQPTPALRRAIKRVFRIFDRDHDDLLSGQEIDTFQEDVFGLALPEARRNALVDVLRHEAKSYVSASGGVSEVRRRLRATAYPLRAPAYPLLAPLRVA